jgi:hypothetical protein
LGQQIVEAKPWHDPTKADSERAIFIVEAHRDHRLFEPWITYARHGEKELSAEESRLVHQPRL